MSGLELGGPAESGFIRAIGSAAAGCVAAVTAGAFRRRLAALLTLLVGFGMVGVLGSAEVATAAVPAVAPEAGQFYPVRGRVASAQTVAAGATATVQVAGRVGVPVSGVATVAVNLTARGSGGANRLMVYPSGAAQNSTTAVRYRGDIWLQNLVTVKVGADGAIKVNNQGTVTATFYADVHGYTLTAPGATPGLTFVPLPPARIAEDASIPANGTHTRNVLCQGGVPCSGVSHVMLTMYTSSSGTGKVTVHPPGAVPPDTNLDYGLGLRLQNYVLARLGPEGFVSFTNSGSSAVAVDLHVTGYMATPQAAVKGGTMQSLNPIRLNGPTTIPSMGTLSLAPLGVSGVPVSGVSAVGVTITTSGSGGGNVRVYPSGTSNPGTHAVAIHPSSQAYTGFIVAKLGNDGKVTVFNESSTQTTVHIDVYAYFKPPATGCPGTPVPGWTGTLPVESFSRTVAMQQSPVAGGTAGPIQYAYTDNAGFLRHGFQEDPGDFGSVQWTAVSGDEAYTGRPALAEQADGRLQLLGHNTSGATWLARQATKNQAPFDAWVNNFGNVVSQPTLARHDDTLVAFAIDGAGGNLWALPQFAPNEHYRMWINLGMTGLSGETDPVVVPAREGLRVFVLDTTGTWRTAVYAHGVLSGCASISGQGFTGQASVVVWPGNKAQIFVRGTDGKILTKKQDDAGTFPGDWTQVGDLTAVSAPAAVISPASGKIELVARAADGLIYSTGETIQASGQWREWVKAIPEGDTTISETDPTVFTYSGSGGPTWAYVIRTSDNLNRVYTTGTFGQTLAAEADDGPPTFQAHTLPAPPAN
jgi:hypothetical protein